VTDRWTEAQLRQQLFWVLALEWAGGTWYVSTAPLEILDGSKKITAIPGLVDVPDVEEALDLWATDQPTLSVALSFTLPVDVPALISKGHDLAGAKATLCQHAYGDTWSERRVVVQGQLVDPEYDAAGEPITCSVEEQISDDQTTLPFAAVTITENTFPLGTGLITTLVEDHIGAVVPLVFGTPGGGVVPGSPAYLLGAGPTGAELIYVLACHTVAAATVTLQAEDLTTSPAVAVDHWTLDDGRVVAYVTVTTGFTASRDVRVIWGDGAALADETGEGIVGAGDLMAYLLRRTTLRVDWGRLEGQRQQLNAYELGGYVDEPVAVGEYLRSVLLDVLPAGLVVGPEGVYPLVWRWAATTADAICDLDTDVDVDVDRVSRVGYSGADELANTISLRYQLDARQDDYSASQLIAPAPELTFDSLSSPEVQVSFARFGDRRLSRETAVVHDAVTAVRVVQWLAARYALPARSVTYAVGPRLAWLQRGDVVTLTDSEIAASDQVCIVESIRWLDDGGLGVTLRYVERRG
jgi:hypothetical protein